MTKRKTKPLTPQQVQARKERKAYKRWRKKLDNYVHVIEARCGLPYKPPVGRPRLPMGLLCRKCGNWKVEHKRGNKPPSWKCAYCQNKLRAQYRKDKKRRRKAYLRRLAAAAVKKGNLRLRTIPAPQPEPGRGLVPGPEWSISI
jgi:hypothetical protein